jgi:hypothetical protein
MPFFDDSGIDESVDRGAFWSAFALLGMNLEKMVVVNILWVLQFAPAIFALIFINAPAPLRLLLVLYTAIAIPPATVLLYALMHDATRYGSLNIGLIRELFAELLLPAYKSFAPLLGVFGFVLWSIGMANAAGWFIVSVLLQVALLLLVLSANYWGLLLVEAPQSSAYTIFMRAARLAWVYPGRSLLLSLTVLLTAILGVISIGGMVLAVPVIITLLQAQMYERIRNIL